MLSSIIVGGGPGGLGPLIWAAQHGLLPDWLDRGIAVVERQAHLGGTLGRFGIHSDSLGGSYLECLEAPGLPEALLPLRDDPLAPCGAPFPFAAGNFDALPFSSTNLGRFGPAAPDRSKSNPKLSPIATS